MVQFPGGQDISPANAGLGPQLMNASQVLMQVDQLKMQKQQLADKKQEALFDSGMKILQDDKLPNSLRAKAYNNAVRSYWNKNNPDNPAPEMTDADFSDNDFSKVVQDISAIRGHKEYDDATKKFMAATVFGSYLNKRGLSKEASSTIMDSMKDDTGPTFLFDKGTGTFMDVNHNRVDPGQLPKLRTIMEFDSSAGKLRNENLDERITGRVNRGAQTLAKRIEDLGVPEAITQFQTLSKLIPATGDIPGVGRGESLVPSFMVGDNGRAVRQAVAALQNVKIKDRSGAAVTPPEFVRFAEEFGSGKLKTEAQLRQGMNQALAAYRERLRNTMSGFDDDERGAYLKNQQIDNPLDVISQFDFSDKGAKTQTLRTKYGY